MSNFAAFNNSFSLLKGKATTSIFYLLFAKKKKKKLFAKGAS